jgi:hypothetical protein
MIDIISIATVTGFVGDASLQIATKNLKMGGTTGWGLTEYFKQHGASESLFIAGGMLAIFYAFYVYILVELLKVPNTALSVIIYAIILDLIFRKFRVFPSLDGYYNHLNYFWSAVWAIIPMLIPYFLYKYQSMV